MSKGSDLHDLPDTFHVEGAGLEVLNGEYKLSGEVMHGRAVWKSATGAWIQWWNDTCGWEMYHKSSGTCDYWTSGSHHESLVSPENAEWKVRGAPPPAPTLTRVDIIPK